MKYVYCIMYKIVPIILLDEYNLNMQLYSVKCNCYHYCCLINNMFLIEK